MSIYQVLGGRQKKNTSTQRKQEASGSSTHSLARRASILVNFQLPLALSDPRAKPQPKKDSRKKHENHKNHGPRITQIGANESGG